jgi:hypothetical protein
LQEVVECVVEAEMDRLPGGSTTGNALDMRGQVVATGRSVEALLTEGGEQINHVNLPGRAPGEMQVLGQLEEVGFGEDHRAERKMFGGMRGGSGCFFETWLANSIDTIIMKEKYGT